MSPAATAGLTRRERERYQEALRRGFLEDRARTRVNLSNRWWERCERVEFPYVVIRFRGGWASVTADLLPMRSTFTEAALEKIRAMFFEHALADQSILFPGRHRVALYRMPTEVVEELAASLVRLALAESVLLKVVFCEAVRRDIPTLRSMIADTVGGIYAEYESAPSEAELEAKVAQQRWMLDRRLEDARPIPTPARR